ncbi:MAG: SDR family NAD(P)-dependent oxidoreductase [Daejeonella sp.]
METEYYTLITGAGEGFGKAIAIECARRKMNLVLISLPGPQLINLACFIERNYNVKVISMETDLRSESNIHLLYENIKSLKIKIRYFVNNAGILSRGYFDELETEYVLDQIKVNVLAPTLLTKLFLHDLKSNSPSGILNVSSMASFFYLPKKQVYGATKSYLLSFSRSLQRELKKYKVSVSTVCPGGMNTSYQLIYQNRKGNWGSRLSIMEPEDVARIAVDGMLKGKKLIIPGFMNNFFMFLDKILPLFINDMITEYFMNKGSSPEVKPISVAQNIDSYPIKFKSDYQKEFA